MSPFHNLSYWTDPYTMHDVAWTVVLFSVSFLLICTGIAVLKDTGVF